MRDGNDTPKMQISPANAPRRWPLCQESWERGRCLTTGSSSLRNLAIAYTSPGLWLSIGELTDAVATGQCPAPRVLGKEVWEYSREHPDERAYWSALMVQEGDSVVKDVVAECALSGFSRIIDIGGSSGDLLAGMLAAAPQATGVCFDRPEVIETARELITRRQMAERVEFVGGDFFQEVPAGGDLYVIKGVLCDWDDERAATILRNCHRAAGSGARLLAISPMIPDYDEQNAFLVDLIAMVLSGGRFRTPDELARLIESCGYTPEKVAVLSGRTVIVEASRR